MFSPPPPAHIEGVCHPHCIRTTRTKRLWVHISWNYTTKHIIKHICLWYFKLKGHMTICHLRSIQLKWNGYRFWKWSNTNKARPSGPNISHYIIGFPEVENQKIDKCKKCIRTKSKDNWFFTYLSPALKLHLNHTKLQLLASLVWLMLMWCAIQKLRRLGWEAETDK